MTTESVKLSNPKDLVGVRKVGLSVLPFRVLWECAAGMLEGAVKYGRHNYRAVGVRASVYFDATMRHLGCWWEGEDIDSESRLNHINKAIISLMVLRDSMLEGNWVDDRPIGNGIDLKPLHTRVSELIDQHADKNPHHYTRVTPVKSDPVLNLELKDTAATTVKVLGYPEERKINFIKAIRELSGAGLKEAKDMSELPFPILVPYNDKWTNLEAIRRVRVAGAFV